MASFPLGTFDHLPSQFPLAFCHIRNTFLDYSCADWDGLHDILGDIPWDDIFKLSISTAAGSEFLGWFQVGIDANILHRKYLVKLH